MDATTETFEQDVLERSRELPVVVDFWAPWCAPCRMLGPVLETEIGARSGAIELAKINVDENQDVAAMFSIRGIPAVKAFKNGHVVSEFVGAQSASSVGRFLDELLGPSAAERLLVEIEQAGEIPDVLEAVAGEEYERALELLLVEIKQSNGEYRARLTQLMVALFADLGIEHPLSVDYRRQLASAVY